MTNAVISPLWNGNLDKPMTTYDKCYTSELRKGDIVTPDVNITASTPLLSNGITYHVNITNPTYTNALCQRWTKVGLQFWPRLGHNSRKTLFLTPLAKVQFQRWNKLGQQRLDWSTRLSQYWSTYGPLLGKGWFARLSQLLIEILAQSCSWTPRAKVGFFCWNNIVQQIKDWLTMHF